MIINRHLRENLLIVTTFLIAMSLMILPLPSFALYAKPQWVFVVLLFWLIFSPKKIGPISAWCVGLYVDLLMGDVLGEHALIFVLFAYVVQRFLRFIQVMPVWQQMVGVGMATFFSVVTQVVILKLTSSLLLSWQLLFPIIINMLIWPWLYFLCRDSRPAYDYRLSGLR